jgi:hypothetical protein
MAEKAWEEQSISNQAWRKGTNLTNRTNRESRGKKEPKR